MPLQRSLPWPFQMDGARANFPLPLPALELGPLLARRLDGQRLGWRDAGVHVGAGTPGATMNRPKKPIQSRSVDKPPSNDWQGPARPKTVQARPRARRAPWEVIPADLDRLDAVRSLLSALNNAYVSTSQIHTLILDIPVLAARCLRRIGVNAQITPALLEKALTTIGNMGLESELLGLLEDLTTCRADLEEAETAPSNPPES